LPAKAKALRDEKNGGYTMSTQWNPFEDILNIQGKLNRIFQDTYRGHAKSKAGDWQPPVDVYETAEEFVILAEVPGTCEDDIDVQISDGSLVIRGEKASPVDMGSDTYYRLERPYGRFSRSFALPNGVDVSQVKASIKDGILRVTLGKIGKPAPKNIKVIKD
jgi:HSP20 family protein